MWKFRPAVRAVVLHLVTDGDDPVKGAREDGLDDKLVRQLRRRTIEGFAVKVPIRQRYAGRTPPS